MVMMSTALRHLAWADGQLFAQLASLPPSALKARLGPSGQSVGALAVHIVAGAEWFRYCLTGYPYSELVTPVFPADLLLLREHLLEIDGVLLAEANEVDELVSFADETGPRSVLRSTILAQAAYHSTEHRTQIACALDAAGTRGLCLDDYDLWAFTKSLQD